MGLATEFADGIDEIFAEFYQTTVKLFLRDNTDPFDEDAYLDPFLIRVGLRAAPSPEEAYGDMYNLWQSTDVTITVPRRTLVNHGVDVNGQNAVNYLVKSRFAHSSFGVAQCYEIQRNAYVDDVFLLFKFLCRVISYADN
jgi:hypothetical protein